MERKKAFFSGILVISLGLVLWPSLGRCSDAGDPYSPRPGSSIGAWYDETWQASGFYRLEPNAGSTTNFHYEYIDTTTPTTAINPTFIQDSSSQDKQTTSGDNENYTDATAGASLPQDIVITEWRVTGHVHFASGM